MALVKGIIIFCSFSLFASGCEFLSPSFPKGFERISAKLDAWENQGEGFSLVLVSNNDRTQGYLEWEAQGIYGRIAEAQKKGSEWALSLGDGGVDGIKLAVRVQGSSVEVRYNPPNRTKTVGGESQKEVRIKATRLEAARGLQVFAARYVTKGGEGLGVSLRLQYLSARQKIQRQIFDDVLRRGKTPYQRAAFVRAQQETISANLRQNASEQSLRPPFQREYEEIQYPVFISERVMSVATQYYLFEGGAHGAASTLFDVIDRETGRRLGVGDIFEGKDWKTALSPLLKAELLRQRSFQDTQGESALGAGRGRGSADLRALGLFEPDIMPSEDIFLCSGGVGFHYDPYQIGPWSMGEFIIVLPWTELKPYLSPALLSTGPLQ
jgi:hypothetical protein